MLYSKIIGVGSYLPEKVLTNQDLEQMVATSNTWIVERTGIKKRHLAADSDTTSMFGYLAAEKALAKAGLEANEVDMVICATCTPDNFFPSTACLIQQQLGITRDIPAFDLSAACSGFVYALTVANQFITAGNSKNVLVIGAEILSRCLDWQDRNTCVLFGDGAGALVLQASNTPGILASSLHANGSNQDVLKIANPLGTPSNSSFHRTYLQMQGQEVFKLAVQVVEQAITEVLAKAKLTLDDIDWIIPHQANIRIIKAIAKKMQLNPAKFISTIAEHGNTSAASIPLALASAMDKGKITTGNKVILVGFGSGMTWGATLMQL